MNPPETMKELALHILEIRSERDVVLARQRARQIAELCGFDRQDQVRIATGVSEVARNAVQYASQGKVEFSINAKPPQSLIARVKDKGPGIENLSAILDGQHHSATGMGLGLIGTKRLMDRFSIDSCPMGGTTVTLEKKLPTKAQALTKHEIVQLASQLVSQTTSDLFAEVQRQNQDLLATMAELNNRQQKLSELNKELEDTNRGVVALYAELEDRADYLHRSSEAKSRFLSHISHEFRTPLHSIQALCRMLLDRLDGDLAAEQEKQVNYINRAAKELTDLVNDLLDLAKVEAGKLTVQPTEFELKEMFSALRGMLRPLLAQNSAVNLVFEDPVSIPTLYSDESKLSQILRNLISNGLKYTERGEVRVTSKAGDGFLTVSITDSGVGIAAEDQSRIFEEFEQVAGPHQQRIKGTGLGLPLSKRLAELLGGTLLLESTLGVGATFSLIIPIRFGASLGSSERVPKSAAQVQDHGRTSGCPTVLVIDDNEVSRYLLKTVLQEHNCQVAEAIGGVEGLRLVEEVKPQAIFLDLMMPDLNGFQVLEKLKANEITRPIPVIIYTSAILTVSEQETLLSKAVAIVPKHQSSPEAWLANVKAAIAAAQIH